MMKTVVLTLLAICFNYFPVFSQNYDSLPKNDVSTSTDISILCKKGGKVFLCANDDPSKEGSLNISREGLDSLEVELKEFDYWTIVDAPEEADFILELRCIKEKQKVGWVYFVYSSSRFINADGEVVLETKVYKSSPTAFNGYSSLNGSLTKMIEKSYMVEFAD